MVYLVETVDDRGFNRSWETESAAEAIRIFTACVEEYGEADLYLVDGECKVVATIGTV